MEQTTGVAVRIVASMMTVALLVGCSAQSVEQEAEGPDNSPPSARVELGEFPAFPEGRLPAEVVDALQAAVDEAVADGSVRGVTAAVIAIGEGSWSGAAGVDDSGQALAANSPLPTASVGKTVAAAQIMQLVEQGRVGLDDPAVDHMPARLEPDDLNGATIRDLLGMRSGLMDSATDEEFVTSGDLVGLAEAMSPFARPDEVLLYANINYYLLDLIIEQVTGRRIQAAVRSGVLRPPAFDGLKERGEPRLSTDAATLARWGYELFGGSVISDASLREMTNFRGEYYGLGAIDFTHPDAEFGYDPESVGHGGLSDSLTVRLVVFPETGVVVAVQANADGFGQIHTLVESLREAART